MRACAKSTQGMVLISILAIILGIALISLAVTEQGRLNTQMTSHYWQQQIAFVNAEKMLKIGRDAINLQSNNGQGSIPDLGEYHYIKIANEPCWQIYEITAIGTMKRARVTIASRLAFSKFQKNKACEKPKGEVFYRSWKLLFD